MHSNLQLKLLMHNYTKLGTYWQCITNWKSNYNKPFCDLPTIIKIEIWHVAPINYVSSNMHHPFGIRRPKKAQWFKIITRSTNGRFRSTLAPLYAYYNFWTENAYIVFFLTYSNRARWPEFRVVLNQGSRLLALYGRAVCECTLHVLTCRPYFAAAVVMFVRVYYVFFYYLSTCRLYWLILK